MLTLNQNLPEGFRPVLFELYFSTGFLERLLEVLGVGLSKTFFDYAGSAVNEFLSLLEAKTGEFLNELDNCELLSALRTTSNEDFSSAAAAPAAGPAATATAAAAGSMPYSSLRMVASSFTSLTVRFTNSSARALISAIVVLYLKVFLLLN